MPSVHAFRRLPLSPPDTEHENSHVPPPSFTRNPGPDFDTTPAAGHQLSSAPERARYQARRTSTLLYQNSSVRDAHDRTHTRSSRNLVVVIPPPDFPLHQEHLGNVLSMGPRHRLSQGTLMPLFSSMFGQLNAIAREYNFPSTVGLCLYLHVNQNGIAMTPRISDDSWQYLFGHLFEARPPPGQQLPIGGSIEFDIDLHKARWYDAWVAGASRDTDPAFLSTVPSQPSFGTHQRGETQTTNADEQQHEDQWDASGSHTLVPNSRPETLRHLRKLSLLDRLDSHIIQTPPRSQNHPSRPDSPTHDLSPIPQSAIPQVAASDLECRVNSWRATTELYPVSMAESYQPTADAVVPVDVTTMDDYALEPDFHKAIEGDEYLWSLTAVKPRSPLQGSSFEHPNGHAKEIVPLTPITVTSWGPSDGEWESIASDESRLPSPDTGERMVEDVMAPRRYAVWGNSFGWRFATTWNKVYPYSTLRIKPTIYVQLQDSNGHVSQYPNLVIYPNVDSCLDTHSCEHVQSSLRSVWGSSFGWQEAVTWRSVYPYSTIRSSPIVELRRAGGLGYQYPNLCIYPATYPYLVIYPACAVEEDILQPVSVILDESNAFATSYPSLVIYPAVYPHLDIYPPVAGDAKTKWSSQVNRKTYSLGNVSTSYPNIVIYPAVYPHFDLYPKVLQATGTLKPREACMRLLNAGCLTAEYPNLTIYPCAYPYLEVYPIVDMKGPIPYGQAHLMTTPISISQGQQIDKLSSCPYIDIYPIAYPYLDIYPPHAAPAEVEGAKTTRDVQSSIDLVPHYPNIIIYPAVYPHLDVYPPFAKAPATTERGKRESNLRRRRIEMWSARTAAQVGLAHLLANNHNWKVDEPLQLDLAEYAWSQSSAGPLTPPLDFADTPFPESVYIDHRIQGSVLPTPSTATTWGPQDDDWYSDTCSIELLPSPDLGQRVLDDVENIRFPCQPWGMVWPFFESVTQFPLGRGKSDFVPEYPHLMIYPPVHLHFEFYPALANVSTSRDEVVETLTTKNVYPALDIYPAVYPHLHIYPTILQNEIPKRIESNVWNEQVETRLPSLYPNLDIYHVCYPYNLHYIYPLTDTVESTQASAEASEASRDYPWLVVYPPVYPFVIPYPFSSPEVVQPPNLEQSLSTIPRPALKSVDLKIPTRYPVLELYPACYPWSLESIYPAKQVNDCSAEVKPQYPCIRIYPTVYPFVEPYPGVSNSVLIPGTLDEDEHMFTKAFLASSELKNIGSKSVVYPCTHTCPDISIPAPQEAQVAQDSYVVDLATPLVLQTANMARKKKNRKTRMESHTSVFGSLGMRPEQKTHLQLCADGFQDDFVRTQGTANVGDLATPPPGTEAITRRNEKTHMELRAEVFRALGKRPVRNSKTHAQLHAEVFQDGILWAPSGYAQDLSSPPKMKAEDTPTQESRCHPSQDSSTPLRSPAGPGTPQSADKVTFSHVQSPPQPPLSPFHIRSAGVPSQPFLAVSETPMRPVSSPPTPFTHKRTGSRLTQVVKSIMPGLPRHDPATVPASPPPEENRERPKDQPSPTRFLSFVDRRPTTAPPLSHTSKSESLTRSFSSPQRKESLVLQRARAYEQAVHADQRNKTPPSSTAGKGKLPPFILPELRPLPPMTDVAETIAFT